MSRLNVSVGKEFLYSMQRLQTLKRKYWGVPPNSNLKPSKDTCSKEETCRKILTQLAKNMKNTNQQDPEQSDQKMTQKIRAGVSRKWKF